MAVYTTWITRSDLAGAAQIACAMLIVVVALVLLERHGRRHQRFGCDAAHAARCSRAACTAATAWAATAAAALPVLIGFVAPALYLVWETRKRLRHGGGVSRGLVDSLGNTLGAGGRRDRGGRGGRAGGRLDGAPRRRRRRNRARWQARVATLGYALPGTVLAIGLLTPALAFDARLAGLLGLHGLPLMGAGRGAGGGLRDPLPGDAGRRHRVRAWRASRRRSSRRRGCSARPATGTLRRVHLPLLRPAIATGALLVFVDAMKELPATLLLRPANFDTLATWLYAEAARGTYEEGAIAALAIVLAGLLPVAAAGAHAARARCRDSTRMTAALQLEAVRLAYEGARGLHTVVDDFSLSLDAGRIGCLLGPSGCGKTTVLRAIAGFEPVRAGSIAPRRRAAVVEHGAPGRPSGAASA